MTIVYVEHQDILTAWALNRWRGVRNRTYRRWQIPDSMLLPLICPISLALTRTFPGHTFSVGCGEFTDLADPSRTYTLPTHADEWAERFDRHETVYPFSFEIDIT